MFVQYDAFRLKFLFKQLNKLKSLPTADFIRNLSFSSACQMASQAGSVHSLPSSLFTAGVVFLIQTASLIHHALLFVSVHRSHSLPSYFSSALCYSRIVSVYETILSIHERCILDVLKTKFQFD